MTFLFASLSSIQALPPSSPKSRAETGAGHVVVMPLPADDAPQVPNEMRVVVIAIAEATPWLLSDRSLADISLRASINVSSGDAPNR
ncbi:MAG TPA: hypothetical protein VFB45_27660 [Pseudolabrys sp.]|nr:hypothetical protein [Pseudolabrys sp.]